MSLLAGAATADITPSRSVQLFGYPHVTRLSTGVHDPLLASALYLSNDDAAAVVLSLDLLFLEPPMARRIRAEVSRAVGIPEACVFIACTHTHSGPISSRIVAWAGDAAAPAPDADYLEFVTRQSVAAAVEAKAAAGPAELAWAVADARGVGGNRRDPSGTTDPECGVLAVRSANDRKWLALALIYGMHPTVLHEDSTLISADFPFSARLHLHESLQTDAPVIHLTAPCGDQSPRWFVNEQSLREAERMGRMLGEAAALSVRRLGGRRFSREPLLAGMLRPTPLIRKTIPSVARAELELVQCQDEYEQLKSRRAERPRVRTAECAVFGAQSALGLAKASERGEIDALLHEYGTPDVHGLRVGDAVLLGLPGELFTAYALDLKRKAGRRVFPVSLVNGDLQGYICTPGEAAAGGYESANSLFAPESGALLVEAGLNVVRELFPAC